MYQIKVLIIILTLTFGGLWASRKVFSPSIFSKDEFNQIVKLFAYITLAAFLSNGYLLYTIICVWLLKRHKGQLPPVAVFMALMYVVPAFDYTMSGLGPIKSLLSWNHLRLLSLALLVPWLFSKTPSSKNGWVADWSITCLVVALGIQFWTMVQEDTPMNAARGIIYFMTDMLVPFWVFSRSIRNVRTLQMVLAGYCISVSILGVIGLFEFSNRWLVYDQLDDWLGAPIISRYLLRGETGWLRVFASTGHSLIMGCVCAVGFLLGLGLAPNETDPEQRATKRWWRVCEVLMFAGLFTSLARGSWVGVGAGLIIWMLTGPKIGKSLLLAMLGAAISLGLLTLTPFGEKVIQTLPFVGDSDQGNVTYRKQLLDISWIVIQDNFWWGSPFFMYNPLMEPLRQGQGIIDVVNVYLATWLTSGLVGLVLFVIPLILPPMALVATVLKTRHRLGHTPAHQMARAVSAAMMAILVIIATTSAVMSIPWLYTIIPGLCIATRAVLLAQSAEPLSRSRP